MDKKRIHSMLEKMTEWVESEMTSKGKEHVDTEEMGEAIDMVKDLAEAEMSVWKACYYKSIVEAMEKSEQEDELMLKMMIEEHGEAEGRAGYDRWRNSKGRFAPKGTGHETSMAMARGRMGYDPNAMVHHDDVYPWPDNSVTGAHYDRYQDAKRHYHESGDMVHKQEMTEHGKHHVEEAIMTMRDIFQEADPQMQQKMKNDLANLYREFGGK